MKSSVVTLMATLVLVSGCSVLENMSSAPTYDPYTLYLTNGMPVHVENEYLDRYACAAGIPLICECVGRASKDCDCHC